MTNNNKTHAFASSRESGPDFLCIGMQKAGTRWLYDLLQFEPGFWMPPFKELHFFDGPFRFEQVKIFHKRISQRFTKVSANRQKHQERTFDARDIMFIEHAITYNEDETSIKWYKELFTPKGDLISGDITPGYSTLDCSIIESIARSLPNLQLLLLLRDPVSRIWSAYNMFRRIEIIGGNFGKASDDSLLAFLQPTSIEEVAQFVNRDDVRKRSFPTKIYSNWRQYFGESQIKCLFLDDILKEPSNVRNEILDFFDLRRTPPSPDRIEVGFNRKSKGPKREMSDEVRTFLIEIFRDELLRCAETFGGAAEHWPKRYGIN